MLLMFSLEGICCCVPLCTAGQLILFVLAFEIPGPELFFLDFAISFAFAADI